MRDSFAGGGGGGPLGMGQSSGGRIADDYAQDPLGMKRRRSFTTGSSVANTGTGAYGSAS